MFTLIVMSCAVTGLGVCNVNGGAQVINVPGFTSERACVSAGNALIEHLRREHMDVIVSHCVRLSDD